jgi:hypothetical protein
MATLTNKTKGLIVIGDKLYKITADDLKSLTSIINNEGGYWRGNVFIRANDHEEFLNEIQKNYKPIADVFGLY